MGVVGRLDRQGGIISKPVPRWSQKGDTTELSEELGWADRGQRPPGGVAQIPENWELRNPE